MRKFEDTGYYRPVEEWTGGSTEGGNSKLITDPILYAEAFMARHLSPEEVFEIIIDDLEAGIITEDTARHAAQLIGA